MLVRPAQIAANFPDSVGVVQHSAPPPPHTSQAPPQQPSSHPSQHNVVANASMAIESFPQDNNMQLHSESVNIPMRFPPAGLPRTTTNAAATAATAAKAIAAVNALSAAAASASAATLSAAAAASNLSAPPKPQPQPRIVSRKTKTVKRRKRKLCTMDGCAKFAMSGGRCVRHGGGKRCMYVGCAKGGIGPKQMCVAHGGGKRCSVRGCNKGAQGAGMSFT